MMDLILNDRKKGKQEKLLTDSDIPTSYYNLYDGTADFSGDWNWISLYSASSLVSPLGHKALKRIGAWQGLSKKFTFQPNQVYTLSCSVYIEASEKADYIGLYGSADNKKVSLENEKSVLATLQAPSNQWVRISKSFTVPTSDPFMVRFEAMDGVTTIHWADLMLNKGAVALDWNYSLNDLRSRLGGVKPSYRLYVTSLKEVA